ncbi:MAG TPA: VWA domain-containing protein [Actinomycetota bacterium]|nr:VWA domain-containing protein [Actinomycetota bacterium]
MTFATPLALLALPLVPLVVLALILVRRRPIRYAVRYPALDVLAEVARRDRPFRWLPAALLLLALTTLLLGAAKPTARVPVPREEATVMLVVDVSGSMEADDVKPTRLDAAREAAGRFLDKLPARFQVGLVIFASEAETLVQPTTDRAAIRDALASLRADGSTAMGDGLNNALDVIEAARQEGAGSPGGADAGTPEPGGSGSGGTAPGASTGPPAVTLLLSDGANMAGVNPLDQAERARELGVPVYTIALGTADGVLQRRDSLGGLRLQPVPPDPETLARIAETTSARFFQAPTSRNLNQVYESLGSHIGFRTEERDVTVAFAAAGLLLLAGAGALRARRAARLP